MDDTTDTCQKTQLNCLTDTLNVYAAIHTTYKEPMYIFFFIGLNLYTLFFNPNLLNPISLEILTQTPLVWLIKTELQLTVARLKCHDQTTETRKWYRSMDRSMPRVSLLFFLRPLFHYRASTNRIPCLPDLTTRASPDYYYLFLTVS